MNITEKKGDITFYKNEQGKLFQQIQDGEIFPVKDGKMGYKLLQSMGKYSLRYNLNGVYGFSIFKGSTPLEDRFWTIQDAISCLKRFSDMDKNKSLSDKIQYASVRAVESNVSIHVKTKAPDLEI